MDWYRNASFTTHPTLAASSSTVTIPILIPISILTTILTTTITTIHSSYSTTIGFPTIITTPTVSFRPSENELSGRLCMK